MHPSTPCKKLDRFLLGAKGGCIREGVAATPGATGAPQLGQKPAPEGRAAPHFEQKLEQAHCTSTLVLRRADPVVWHHNG